jgi:hypothetical protein
VPKGKASLWAENCPNFLAGRKKLKFFSGKFALVADKPLTGFKRGMTRLYRVILIMGLPLLKFSQENLPERRKRVF